MESSQVLLHLINGFVWGWIVALMALGLSLVYGILGIINVAHGAFYMLGAVIAWYIIQGSNFWLALILAPLVVGVIGLVAERLVLRPVESRPVMTIMATFGLTLIFQQLVLLFFGGAPRYVKEPFLWNFAILGFQYGGYRLFVAAFAIIIISALWAFLHHSKYGRWIRATSQNRELALAFGIPVPAIYSLTFSLGAMLAAIAGVLMAPIVSVDYRMGLDMLISAFIVVIVGGLGSLKGAVIAALCFSEMEGLLALVAFPTAARMLALLLMGLILILRPQGLFAGRSSLQ